jgi:hypothetical protein
VQLYKTCRSMCLLLPFICFLLVFLLLVWVFTTRSSWLHARVHEARALWGFVQRVHMYAFQLENNIIYIYIYAAATAQFNINLRPAGAVDMDLFLKKAKAVVLDRLQCAEAKPLTHALEARGFENTSSTVKPFFIKAQEIAKRRAAGATSSSTCDHERVMAAAAATIVRNVPRVHIDDCSSACSHADSDDRSDESSLSDDHPHIYISKKSTERRRIHEDIAHVAIASGHVDHMLNPRDVVQRRCCKQSETLNHLSLLSVADVVAIRQSRPVFPAVHTGSSGSRTTYTEWAHDVVEWVYGVLQQHNTVQHLGTAASKFTLRVPNAVDANSFRTVEICRAGARLVLGVGTLIIC